MSDESDKSVNTSRPETLPTPDQPVGADSADPEAQSERKSSNASLPPPYETLHPAPAHSPLFNIPNGTERSRRSTPSSASHSSERKTRTIRYFAIPTFAVFAAGLVLLFISTFSTSNLGSMSNFSSANATACRWAGVSLVIAGATIGSLLIVWHLRRPPPKDQYSQHESTPRRPEL